MNDDTDDLCGATLSEFDGVRFLHLGSPWVQGAMRKATASRIELEYVQRMTAWLLWRPIDEQTRGHAVHLGLGAATLTRFTAQRLRMPTTTVEINPSVIDACRLWFRLPADGPRLTVVCDDAGRWVADSAHHGSAQVLDVDLYDHDAAAPVLDSVSFYRACRDCLSEGGLLSVNLFGRSSSYEESLDNLREVFGADQVWAMTATREGNRIVIAARGVAWPGREEALRRAHAIEQRWGLPARKWLRLLRGATAS